MTRSKHLFAVEIIGSNKATAKAYGPEGLTLEAGVDTTTNRALVRYPQLALGRCEITGGEVALFDSRELANEIGLACRWNNQRYRVLAARGSVRSEGKLVPPGGDWASCQSA